MSILLNSTTKLKRAPEKFMKNSANERLKKLRQSIQEEVKSNQKANGNPTTNITTSTTKPQNNFENVIRKLQKIRNGFKANDRLKRLRETQKEVCNKSKSTSPSSSLRRDNNLKRKIDNNDECNRKKLKLGGVEPMDWQINNTITDLDHTFTKRQSIDNSGYLEADNKNNSKILIVTDTNIFLKHLHLLKEIVDLKGNIEPAIYIPWIILEELDYLKEDKNRTNISKAAINATKFIQEGLNAASHKRIIGQTLLEANQQMNTNKVADNKIIASCLQVSYKYTNVILFTDDVNLRNKAMFNKIITASSQDILRKIRFKNSKSQRVLDTVTGFLWEVIKVCTKNAYGNVWNRMDLLKTAPTCLEDCLKIIQKYWMAVFSHLLLKQFQKVVQDFLHLLQKFKDSGDNSELPNQLVAVSSRLCLFVKDIEECREMAEKCIAEINR